MMEPRRRLGLLDFYGSEYLSPVGQDSADVTSTDPRRYQTQPQFQRWQPDALSSGERARAGVFGKALGLLGLDADGARAQTSWTDAAKHTAGNIINLPQDVGNQLLNLQNYQPVMSGQDRGTAARQAVETFGLAGLAPLGGVAAGRLGRAAGLQDGAGPRPGVTRMDGSALYANSDNAAVPGLLMDEASRMPERGTPTVAGHPSGSLAPNLPPAVLKEAGQQGHMPSDFAPGPATRSSMPHGQLSDTSSPPALPNDTAARMGRANQLGFDVDHTWYHVTDKDFLAFKNKGVERNTDPDAAHLARLGTWVSNRPDRVHASAGGDRTMPLLVRHGDYVGARAEDLYNAGTLRNLFDMARERGFKASLQKKGYKGVRIRDEEFSGLGPADLNAEVNRAADAYNAAVKPINRGNATPDELQTFRDAQAALNEVSERLSDARLRERVTSAVIFDPKDIRSKFAAFDPAKSDSANLLAANSKEAAVPGITASGNQPDPYQYALQMQARRKALGLPN